MRRFFNIDTLLNDNRMLFGKIYDNLFNSYIVYPIFTSGPITGICEVYTFIGDYIGQVRDISVEINDNHLYLDTSEVFEKLSLVNGSYKLVFTCLYPMYNELKVQEISPDRTEIKIKFKDNDSILYTLQGLDQLNNVAIKSGSASNNIINFYIYNGYLYCKTINPIPDDIIPNSIVTIDYELTDNLVDSVHIFNQIPISKYKKLRGPKFDIDADRAFTESSIYKCWDDLLGSDMLTSQNIIDKIFNTDVSVTLNIDWSFFENYIFYSTAKSRIENFHYKITLINELKALIEDESEFTGTHAEKSIAIKQDNLNKIIENFDSFERYLYYVDDPKIFTHETLGPVTPWPKETISGVMHLKAPNDPTVESWYNNLLTVATSFDQQNTRSLWYAIPEHMLMDEGNSQYVLFVEMLGHHFDNIWLYVNALTEIHTKDEHFKRGPANELLEHIAKSFGWQLNNTRNQSDLWLYKLGVSENGEIPAADNMVDHESQSYQVWRRIVNNLPYLLKTKGTTRSIKALMSIFGIPSTLLSIKEYGGPGIDGNVPLLIEDRYHYKLSFDLDGGMIYRWCTTNLSTGQETLEPCISQAPLMTNGDFLGGLYAWDLTGIYDDFPTIGINTVDGNEVNCLEILGDVTQIGLSQTLNLQENKRYKITVGVANTNELSTFEFEFQGQYLDAAVPNSAGENIELEFTVLQDITQNFNIYVIPDTVATALIYNITVEEIQFPLRYPDTYEFRFQCKTKHDEQAIARFHGNGANIYVTVKDSITVVDGQTVQNLVFYSYDSLGDVTWSHTSADLPIYNDEMWTIRIYKMYDDISRIHYEIGCTNDCLYGKLTYHASGIIEQEFTPLDFLGQAPFPKVALGYAYNTENFDGWMQGYKEYFTVYSEETFKEHCLNPQSYNTDSFNGAYHTLYKYFPFGLDLQRSGLTTLSSSQPNRTFSPATIKLNGFSGDQNSNYHNDSETYYIQLPKIGGKTIQSAKIRIEDTLLSGLLSPTKKSNYNEFDEASPDTNRLAIVFSLADQINRDIFNHAGNQNLDNYVAAPENDYIEDYPELTSLRRKYFKKYQQRNDINAFIKLLSAYDYSFFEQIKQLVPGRANLIAGILIEPHILEKNKVVIMKKPQIEMPVFEPEISLNIYRKLGEFECIEGDIISKEKVDAEISKMQMVISSKFNINAENNLIKGVLESKILVNSEIQKPWSNGCIRIGASGIGSMEDMLDQWRLNCQYKQKSLFYTYETLPEYSKYNNFNELGDTYETLPIIENAAPELILNHDGRMFHKYISVFDIDILFNGDNYYDIEFPDISIPTGTFNCKFYFEWVGGTPVEGDYVIECYFEGLTETGDGGFILKASNAANERIIKPYHLELISTADDIYTLTIRIKTLSNSFTGSFIRFYGFEIYKQHTPYYYDLAKTNNELRRKYQYSKLESISYQNDEYSSSNNMRFAGSKLSGPGFNLNSTSTVDRGPVVEFHDVDPLILIIDANNESNLTVN